MTGYTKLAASILDSTIWREDNTTRILWITMLAMAGREGIVESSVPGLADRARITIAETEAALIKLSSPDAYSRTKEHDGRRIEAIDGGWQILNHAKYRRLLSAEERREYQRVWQSDKRKSVNTCKQVSTPVNTCKQSTVLTQAEAEAEATTAQRTHKRLTLDQVKTKCQMSGWPEAEGERFWHHFESSGWIDKNGNRIVNWQSKLAIWMADAKSRPAEKAHQAGNRTPQSGISASMQAMLDTKKLERIEKRIADIRNSVDGHQTLDDCDREELRDLKKQCKELKQTLGITV